MIIITKTNKLFMYKIILSDDHSYHGYRGPTHFAKTRVKLISGYCGSPNLLVTSTTSGWFVFNGERHRGTNHGTCTYQD